MSEPTEKELFFFNTLQKTVMEKISKKIKDYTSPNQEKPRSGGRSGLTRNLTTFSFKNFMKAGLFYGAWPGEIREGTLAVSIGIQQHLCQSGFCVDFMALLSEKKLTELFREKGFRVFPDIVYCEAAEIPPEKESDARSGMVPVRRVYPFKGFDDVRTIKKAARDIAFLMNRTFPLVRSLVKGRHRDMAKENAGEYKNN